MNLSLNINYFLSDMHNRWRCQTARKTAAERKQICLGCDMDEIYGQFFCGAKTPYAAIHFLFSMWSHADHLSGYVQQDAHEFLVSVLDGVHLGCSIGHDAKGRTCPCVIHRLYGGELRSDVICSACKKCSTAFDPIFDISLDLRATIPNLPMSLSVMSGPNTPSSSPFPSSSASSLAYLESLPAHTPVKRSISASSSLAESFPDESLSLKNSLSSSSSPTFIDVVNVHPSSSSSSSSSLDVESLSFTPPTPKSNYNISSSLSAENSLPPLDPLPPSSSSSFSYSSTTASFFPLPPILVPQDSKSNGPGSTTPTYKLIDCLKRFTHVEKLCKQDYKCPSCNSNQEATKQLSVNVLAPVLCFHLKRFEHGNVKNKNVSSKIDCFVEFPARDLDVSPFLSQRARGSILSTKYDLFGVIVHVGQLDSGHYICFVRRDRAWYRIDDTCVSQSSEAEALRTKAYLLFYLRQDVTDVVNHNYLQR